ncbi:MAG: hypothetical protein HC914_09875 [Chloroflexaceae bacterium]|nr:hypothetical protein [Chloroflexaceae bacterium]
MATSASSPPRTQVYTLRMAWVLLLGGFVIFAAWYSLRLCCSVIIA